MGSAWAPGFVVQVISRSFRLQRALDGRRNSISWAGALKNPHLDSPPKSRSVWNAWSCARMLRVKSREPMQPSCLVGVWRRFSVTENGMPIHSSLSLVIDSNIWIYLYYCGLVDAVF